MPQLRPQSMRVLDNDDFSLDQEYFGSDEEREDQRRHAQRVAEERAKPAGKITYASAYGITQPQTDARRRWGNVRETIRYSPYNAHTRLNIQIPPGLKKDDWLKHHGYQNTIEFEDHATPEEYGKLNMKWAAYGQAGGYGPMELPGGGLSADLAIQLLDGGKKTKGRKSKGRKSKGRKSKGRKSKGRKSKGRRVRSKGRRVRSKGRRVKSKGRRVKSKGRRVKSNGRK